MLYNFKIFNCSGNHNEITIQYTQKEMKKELNHNTVKKQLNETQRKAIREERKNNKATRHT